jgi:Exonuclease VII, large subunit
VKRGKPDTLSWLRGENLKAYRAYLALFRGIQGLYQRLAESVTPALLENLSLLDQLKAGSDGLRQLGISQETDLSTVARLLQRIYGLEHKLQEIDRPTAELALRLGPAFQNVIAAHEQGLRELRQLVELTVALEPSLWKIRHECFDDEELDEVLPRLQARITALREQRACLSDSFKVDRLPPASELEEIQAKLADRGLLRWLKGDWRAARRRLLALSAKPRRGLKMLLPVLGELVSLVQDEEALDGDQKFHRLLGEHFQGLETAVDDLQKICSWYRRIRQFYGSGFGAKVGLGQALIDMPVDVAIGVRSLADQGFLKRISEALEELDRLKVALPRAERLRQGNVPLLGGQGILPTLRADITRSLAPCQKYLVEPDLSLRALEGLLSDLIQLRDLTAEWRASDIDAKWFDGTLGLMIGLGRGNKTALTAAAHTESLASALDSEVKTPALKEAIYGRPERRQLEELAACGRQLGKIWPEHRTTLQQFSDLTVLNFATWIRKSGDQLGKLIARNDHALMNPEWLAN